MRRVPLRAALQITSLEKNKEYRQGSGKREAGKLEGCTQEQAGERRLAGSQKQRQKEGSLLSPSQEHQAKSMGVPRTVCGCAGTRGCICYLTEIAQHLHHRYLIY